MLPTWECPHCHIVVSGEEMACGVCKTSRPSPGLRAGEDLRPTSSGFRDSLRKQSKGILDDIRGELSATMRDSAASLERLDSISSTLSRGSSPAASFPTLRNLPTTPEQAQGVKVPFQKVTTRDLQVECQALPRLNYALVHCGISLIPSLEIRNSSTEAAQDVLVKAWVATDFGEPWQKSIPSIPAGASHIEHNIVIPLRKSRLQEVREAEMTYLRVDVFTEGELQFSETRPLEVLAYNEWFFHPANVETTASFVQPNSEATEKIVSLVRDRLRREFHETDLSGYQSGRPGKIVQMLEAFYYVMQQDLKISYINPPPSFETGQKVFFPEQVYEHRRGTCLDLALLAAGCVERMGLHPLFFLIQGHAFFGVWLKEQVLKSSVLSELDLVTGLISSGAWLPLNSTTFASSSPRTFEDCREEGRKYLKVGPEGFLKKPQDFMCAVDVQSARYAGIKPIPPLVVRS